MGTQMTMGAHIFGEVKLLNLQKYERVKRQSKRDVRNYERELRARKTQIDSYQRDRRRDFHSALMQHSVNFYKFHREKENERRKIVKAVKTWAEERDKTKERDEAQAERDRLQALKENNMEEYAKLIQDTKNTRLKYLLNQTDSYIATINSMIQEQKDTGVEFDSSLAVNAAKTEIKQVEEVRAKALEPVDNVLGNTSNSTAVTKSYFENTHKKTEKVAQPRMLKGGDLKEYQLAGLQWMVSLYNNNLNGILADDMGLGETIQTIALLSYILEFKHNHGPFLIVVPLSTLSNWVNECTKWAPDLVKVVYKGLPDHRRQIFKEIVEPIDFNVLITTYEYIMKDKASLKKIYWQYIIVDEGHRMKNAESKFAQTLGTIYQSKNRILLTGTPLQNNLPELWALLNFLLPTIFSSMDTFDQWFNKPFAAFRGGRSSNEENEDSTKLTEEEQLLIVHRLHEVLRPFMLRRVKDQVLDQLPDKVECVLRCSLSGWQKHIYNSVQNKSISSRDPGNNSGFNNAMMQLRKICNHPYLFLNEWYADDDLIRSSGKFELLDRMLPKLKAAGHRVLLFSQMTQVMTILERFFDYRKFMYLRLDGGTSSEEREKRMYMFNDPDSPYFIFLLSTRAGGLGLNLATADTVIIFDSDWNPMMDAQAQDRAHRIGQRNEVRVFRLITTSPIEERILARATDKKNLNSLAVEAGQFNKGASGSGNTTNSDDKKELMQSLLKEWSESAEVDGDHGGIYDDTDVPDDEQLNQLMAIHDGDLATYKEIDALREQTRLEEWKERHARSAVVPPMPGRLMTKEEQPIWINENTWSTKTMAATVMGVMATSSESGFADSMEVDVDYTGGRKRKEVVYDDGMTDAQFSRAMEAKADEFAREMKRQKFEEKERREAKWKESLPPGPRIPDEICAPLEKMIQELLKMTREDGTLPSYYFKVKPDRKIFYDYYDIIENPISFKEINYKLKRRQYADIAALESDFALLCSNARTYNAVGSMVYMDSEYLREAFYSKLSVICKKNGLPVIEKPAITEVGENGHIFGENNGTASNSNDLEEEDISPLKLKINFSKQKL